MSNYYQILEIHEDCTTEEIKRAYKRLAMKYHPDKNPGNKECEEKFKKISQAYEILSNEDKRKIYDLYGEEGFSERRGGSGVFSFFESMFGGTREKILAISIKEAFLGCIKSFEISKKVVCHECQGGGARDGFRGQICSLCRGQGITRISLGFLIQESRCNRCHGLGKEIPANQRCPSCQGKGEEIKSERISVAIPERCPPGVIISASEDPSSKYIVKILQDKDYEITENYDLVIKRKFSLVSALLGKDFSHETIDGRKLIITIGGQVISPNTLIKVEKEGLTKNSSLIIIPEIEFPQKLSIETRERLNGLFPERSDERNIGLPNVVGLLIQTDK